MSLVKNTQRLLQPDESNEPASESRGSCTVSFSPALIEYEALSSRELYDKSIISADRHHSSAGEWVVRDTGDFYQVRVVSRPVYRLPQVLSLRFRSHWDAEVTATEYLSLLSVYAREPLIPVGITRNNDIPISVPSPYKYTMRGRRAADPREVGIDSRELRKVLEGMAASPEDEVNAALAAARFYHSALSMVHFDRSIAFVSLVSAIETLAGKYYQGWKPCFDEIQKLSDSFGSFLKELSVIQDASHLVEPLKRKLAANEHLPTQKFTHFVIEHLPKSFWEAKDNLYEDFGPIFPEIQQPDLPKLLQAIYSARSRFVHGGQPLPRYVEFGMRESYPVSGLTDLHNIPEQPLFIPPMVWFERVVHLVIVEYLRRKFALDVWRNVEERRKQKEDLLSRLRSMPENVQESLRRLARWTRQWVRFAVINPMAPNKQWADSPESIELLQKADLIRLAHGSGLDGSSYLKDREVAEAVGEFAFGAADNPFLDCEIFLPKGLEEHDFNA